jgi:hypothetical protein
VTGEQGVLPVQRDGTHFTLDGVAVDLDAAVWETPSWAASRS